MMVFWYLIIFLKIHIIATGKIRHTFNATFLNIKSVPKNQILLLDLIRFTNASILHMTYEKNAIYINSKLIVLKSYKNVLTRST